jgi:hypothetical protein
MKRVAAQLPTSDSHTRRARLIGVRSERTPERAGQPGQDLEQDSGGANQQFVFRRNTERWRRFYRYLKGATCQRVMR